MEVVLLDMLVHLRFAVHFLNAVHTLPTFRRHLKQFFSPVFYITFSYITLH